MIFCTHTGFTNTFFEVNFNANFTQATCKLFHLTRLECTFVYMLNESRDDNSLISATSLVTGTSRTDTVIINLKTLPNVIYYFIATAKSGSFTAAVEGTFIRQTGIITVIKFPNTLKRIHKIMCNSIVIPCVLTSIL